jgi:lactate dehydrogenase-like 2-hydroxyacid dehydrogenase
MKRDVLLVAPIFAPTLVRLDADYAVHRLWEAPDRDSELARLAPRTEVLVTTGGAGASRDLIDPLPKLRLIACFGVGVDAIDIACAA